MQDQDNEIRKCITERIAVHANSMSQMADHAGALEPNAILATEDYFERTRRDLATRARQYMITGALCTITSVAVLSSAAYFLYTSALPSEVNGSQPIDTRIVIMLAIRYSAAASFVVLSSVVLLRFARTFFAQATTLHNKRNALTFGRLTVYLRGGSLSQEELQYAFHWSTAFDNAFEQSPEKAYPRKEQRDG